MAVAMASLAFRRLGIVSSAVACVFFTLHHGVATIFSMMTIYALYTFLRCEKIGGMSIEDHRMYNYAAFLQELFLDRNMFYPRQFKQRGGEHGGRIGNKCQKCTFWIFNCSPC